MAASPEDLPAQLWPDGRFPAVPYAPWATGGATPSTFDSISSATAIPASRPWRWTSRATSTTIGVHDPLHLVAHVVTPAIEPFAFRWLVYERRTDGGLWFVTTIGSDDAGEGYSVANNDLTITPGGRALNPEPTPSTRKLGTPRPVARSGWYRGNSAGFGLTVSQTIDGIAPGQVVEGGTFRVYSRTWMEGMDGYVFIDDVFDERSTRSSISARCSPGATWKSRRSKASCRLGPALVGERRRQPRGHRAAAPGQAGSW